MNIGKAPGPDEIGNEMLRQLGPRAESAVLQLINRTWQEGRTPAAWHTAITIPILKKGKPAGDPASYRPISLLSCLGKLAERLVQRRMQAWLETHDKFNKNQAGFRRGRSTEDQLMKVTQSIFDALEDAERLRSVLVLLDFKAAYDRVWLDGLTAKMARMGIPACMIKWTMSTLRDRRAKVKWNSTLSKSKRLPQGLAQGLILAPVLWLI